MKKESKPWLWVAAAIVFAAVLMSGTLLVINGRQPDCSRWDRAVEAADQVWDSHVDAMIAKYGPIGGSTAVAAWEGDRGAVRALAAETGQVPTSPDPTSMGVAVLLNESGAANGWTEEAGPFAVRPAGC